MKYILLIFLFTGCVTETSKPSVPKAPPITEEEFKLEPVQAPPTEIKIPQHESGMIKIRVVKGSVKKTNEAHSRALKQANLNCKPRTASPIDDLWSDAKTNHKRLVATVRYFNIEYKCF